MPVFTNLADRIANPPFDQAVYDANLPTCKNIAAKMPLVHTTGKGRSFDQTVVKSPVVVPTSQDTGYYTDGTRNAENSLGLPPSVYFYAGRAHKDFGNVAMAFGPTCEAGHAGSVTPFDTGGLMNRKIALKLDPIDGEAERIAYGRASILPLNTTPCWRETFAHVLAAYFASPSDYWLGRPNPYDLESLYDSSNEYRAWTFEVRFSEPQSILERAAWCADTSVMDRLRQLDEEEELVPSAAGPTPLRQFLEGPAALDPRGTSDVPGRIEQWIRDEVLKP